MMLWTWIVYDIQDDGVRGKVAQRCKDYGLQRVQLSVFSGMGNRNTRDSLLIEIGTLISPEDSVIMFTLCDACGKKVVTKGRRLNDKDIRDELTSLIL